MRLGLVGFGTISTLALDALTRAAPASMDALILHTKPQSAGRAVAWAETYRGNLARDVLVTGELAQLISAKPDLVVEAAGHEALAHVGPAVLASGTDLIVCSVGALSDERLRQRLEAAAQASGAQMVLSPGAVGGLDILGAARLAGLSAVTYTSRKPPQAWKGTAAEARIDLAAVTHEAVFFEGTAREAARMFPQNANVAATIALAGAGLDATRVRLVADPEVARNIHEIAFASACADVTIRIEGLPAPGNPKTSATTGYALARMLLERLGASC